jgi:magnesium-transporting ATPase (P-type)
MDEVLDVLDLVADLGGLATWLSRLLGIVAVLAGVAIWLFTDITLLVPAVLVAVGLALIVVPELLLAVAELA